MFKHSNQHSFIQTQVITTGQKILNRYFILHEHLLYIIIKIS